ncbi:MAG: sugar phosphate nucleotidyltransferase [Eubacteriales bacterium]|nr:sugar phosphate nucleotidyltransferase [Eubacteriales bacterium]
MNNGNDIVIMAAGMGSRFGGLKQMEPMGPNGEAIIDYSVYDAKNAGFSRAVIIIKKEIEKDFRETVGKRLEKLIDVEYAFQEVDKVPSWFSVPEGRTRPWGTGHAVLCAKDVIKGSFAVINSDDYYGQMGYKALNDYLSKGNGTCMVGFSLGNTITENGTVNRGICETDNDGFLTAVTEREGIDKNSGIPLDTVVSMNMWGFRHDFLDNLEEGFERFLKNGFANPMKAEYYLPFAVDERIKAGKERVKVLVSTDKWYGVTYKEDKESVKNAISNLISLGKYPYSGL